MHAARLGDLGGCGIVNFGIDRARAAEQLVAVMLVEKFERMAVVIRHRVYTRKIALMLVSADIVRIDAADKHVARKTLVSEFFGVVDNAEQKAAIDDKHIRKSVDRSRMFRSGNDLSYPSAAVDFERGAHFVVAGGYRFFVTDYGNVRSFFDMEVKRVRKIDVANVVAVAHNDVSRAGIAKIIRAVGYCLETRRIHRRTFSSERRKYGKTAVFAREIPTFSGADMLHKRLIIIFGDNADVVNPAVYHIRENEVDKAVPSGERNGRKRTSRSKFAYFFVVDIGKYYSDGFHNVPSCFFSTISPEATRAPSAITVPLPISAIRVLSLFSSPTTAFLPILTFSSTMP